MKKKILGFFLIILLVFTNYYFTVEAVGLTYTREGGGTFNDIARIIDDDIYLDGEYNMYSVPVPMSNIEIYKYNSTTPMACAGTEPVLYSNEEKYFLKSDRIFETNRLWFNIKLGAGSEKQENIATIIYRDALINNGIKYDLKLNIKEINKTGTDEALMSALLGVRPHSDEAPYDASTYYMAFSPNIGTNSNRVL